MATKSKAAGNYWLIIIISTIIASLVAGFFLIYVPENEERITERNFRELNRVSDNLRTRAKSLIKNARNVVKEKSVGNYIFCGLSKLEKGDTSKVFLNVESHLNNEINRFNSDISFRELSVERIKAHNDESFSENKIELHINTPDYTSVLYSDRIGLNEISGNTRIFCEKTESGVPDSTHTDSVLSNESKTHLSYKIEIATPNLVGDLLHFDFFESFILTTKDWLIYESNPQGTMFYEEFSDSLAGTAQTRNARVRTVAVNGVEYKAFVRPIHISKSQHWNLVGFIRADEFRSESWKISRKWSLILLVVSVLVLLALPLIKLNTINDQEKVNTRDIVLAYFSIISLTSLLTIVIYFLYVFNMSEVQNKESLEYLEAEIKGTFAEEYYDIADFLVRMEAAGAENMSDSNEAHSPFDEANNHEHFFWTYPFLEDYFVIDSSGAQEKKWTVRKHRTPKFNVKNRGYVDRLFQETGYKTGGCPSAQMFLESIVSYNTGQQLAVITRKQKCSNRIFGITSKLYSLYDTVLPYGYQFSVIDKSGLVHFHSDSDKNLNENFFEEVKDTEAVRQRIHNNNLGYTSISYHGSQSAASFSRLHEELPFYLVLIGDKSTQLGVFSRVIRITISIIILLILLFMGVVYLKAYLKHKPPSYDSWLRPISMQKQLKYEQGWGVVFFLCVLIPLLIFNYSYNRETFTLNKLKEIKTAELLNKKEIANKEYIAWLGEELCANKFQTLANIHSKRMNMGEGKGNYMFKKKILPEYSMAGQPVFYSFSEFDHEMDNAFRAYKERTLFMGMQEVTRTVKNRVTHNPELTRLNFASVGTWLNKNFGGMVFTLLALLVLLLGAIKIFRRVKKRLFKVQIQKMEDWDWECKMEKVTDAPLRLFLVDVTGEAFSNDVSSTEVKQVEWSSYAGNPKSDEDEKIREIRVSNFPASFEEISKEDAIAMKELLSSYKEKKITVICKQSPLLLIEEAERAKEKEYMVKTEKSGKVKEQESKGGQKEELQNQESEIDKTEEVPETIDLYSSLLEFLSTFDTYYKPICFTDEEREEACNKKLKTRMKFQKRFVSLDKNEQYLLYDLAEDGIINTKNTGVINALFKKGLIKGKSKDKHKDKSQDGLKNGSDNNKSQNGSEHLILTQFYFYDDDEEAVNKKKEEDQEQEKAAKECTDRATFRQFILDTFDESALKAIKSEVESKSSWARYRTFILLVMGGLFLFILFTQQQYLNEIVAIVTSLIAIFGAIAKLTNVPSMFGKRAE
ncbi:hypothetical protein [Gracilimonas mengyeensis]|uniref:Cache domain-containing protein n=1 Tax=Gracilimonas mengyeensis TaxID=1302730 RepID=A0A521CFM3_9BACT|nr:hypothetical protein [Gracilimonas mengyeensis]SMO58219.1 hypothetical protein SAMN06265219_105112 [Gracilimonas mengyeensis]